ncbi:MAG TPA: hypothetical protein VFX59_08345 [Polyangiales bacterium]|nr:hypothetical protein [Polyangiales bacterium]
MSRTLPFCLILLFVSAAHAAPSEETLACVAASTQGQTDRDDGKLLAARTKLRACTRESCPAVVRDSCQRWLAELEPRIPSVVLRVHDAEGTQPADVLATIDGARTPLDGQPVQLEPGLHVVRAESKGVRVERKFGIAEREYARIVVLALPARPAPPPEPPPPPPRAYRVPIASWVLAGAGVAGVVTFAALRTKTVNDLNGLGCAPTCSDRQLDEVKRVARAADGSLGVGLAAFGGAALWALGSWVAHRDDRRSAFVLQPERAGLTAGWTTHY